MKIVVDVEPIYRAMKLIADFNAVNLGDLELRENGVPIVISPETMEEWRFMGMSNESLLDYRVWEPESKQAEDAPKRPVVLSFTRKES